MFKAIINQTPLVNPTADSFFHDKIYGDSFNNDVTFVSTLRALVAPRMQEEERLKVGFYRTSYEASQISTMSDTRAVKAIADAFDSTESGNIYIHSFASPNQSDNYAMLELYKRSFIKAYKDWGMLEKVTTFFRKQFYVICFINPELKSVAIFADNLDMRYMHYLQCAILAFLPWYFNPDEGVSELEMSLIESLREKTSSRYEEVLAKIAEQYDFRSARIRQMLEGFETKFEKVECDNVRHRISRALSDIDSLNRQIGEVLQRKNELEIRLLGLEAKIAQGSDDSEIMEYFLCNSKLCLDDVTDSHMTFIVKDYLTYFDEEMAKSMIDNSTSYVYRPNGRTCNNLIPAADIKRLMTAIFIDQKLRIKFCAAYTFDLNGSVQARQEYYFGDNGRNHMPNPHINRYSCLGNYQRTINDLLKDRNYIGAIEQCAASCKSLSFADSTVMQTFMETIYGMRGDGENTRYIELPDGSMVAPKDAIKWLKEQEGESNE